MSVVLTLNSTCRHLTFPAKLTSTESTDLDFSKNLHNIMHCVSSKSSKDMGADKGDNKEEEHPPAKKRGVSSKSSTKGKGTHQVLPPSKTP
jgi:hypothetical protein